MELTIQKTYKLYIGGEFLRTESGRYYQLFDKSESLIANVCLGSRKDIKNAVSAARKALSGWKAKSGYNKSQVLYRLAEMLEGRKPQFREILELQGYSNDQAKSETNLTIDRIVYYAGWCDKFQQVFSSVNPVASGHFNFSVPEPMGVIGVIAPEESPLLGFVSSWLPALAGGNTVVVIASQQLPLAAMLLAEAVHSSDFNPGIVNIVTGHTRELAPHIFAHMDLNAAVSARKLEEGLLKKSLVDSTENVKRYLDWSEVDWSDESTANPYHIKGTQELKTTWHPVQKGFSGSGGY